MSIQIDPTRGFLERHVGPDEDEQSAMLSALGLSSMEELVDAAVPRAIRLGRDLALPEAIPEDRLLEKLRAVAARNRVYRSYLGMGYHDTLTPAVILRNVMENPAWYTQYTPYQAEIAQGRLEALLTFQTMCVDLTGLEIANASLLDEGTAAAEAMGLLLASAGNGRDVFQIAADCHPQTIEVVRTRARPLGVEVVVAAPEDMRPDGRTFGVLLQYPGTDGRLADYRALVRETHEAGAHVVVATDLLALTLLEPPGAWGADVCVGNSQRFGVPLGYGGPHAAFLTAREEFKRRMPGRIIGVSVDRQGREALRMALQTREQHIRREKATSNICTAQVLLAVMAAMYAVYHGPQGLIDIARRVRGLTSVLAEGLRRLGHQVVHPAFFDTLRVRPTERQASAVLQAARDLRINLRDFGDGTLGVALDEATRPEDVDDVLRAFGADAAISARRLATEIDDPELPTQFRRTSSFLQHPVFNTHHSETEMLRYLNRLASRDLSLTTSMIALGSCTMKLNATTEMEPVTWPEFGRLHPFVPADQAEGYRSVTRELEGWLAEITGFQAASLQPNSGAQGEYAGLLVIRAYHEDRGESRRNVCLIPSSAHGTNPASAVMAGMEVHVVRVDENGSVDLADLEARAKKDADRLAAIMITYPSTHGVFEEQVRDVCRIVHENGGLVYLDGANLNAQVGLARPGDYGADVCHVNLHKTFAIPHGGGGPGMGPICVNEKLAPYLPGHPLVKVGGEKAIGPVSSAPWGSASILLISWAYIALLGRTGVRRATEVALLNANYMARRLEGSYDVLYRGRNGRVAHEFILDLRPLRRSSGVTEEDVAKRLIDYGFHAPTVSFPVAGTLMIEPTESEPKSELDRFVNALISIREEVQRIEIGLGDREDNVLKGAPHTALEVVADEWGHAYSREEAAYPAPWSREHKFWPVVGRVDNAYGDRNLVCVCPPVSAYAEEEGAPTG
jgi:glycine dehydrogenase